MARSSRGFRGVKQRLPPAQSLSQKAVWHRIFEAMADDPDAEYLIIGTIVRAHQHAAGAKKGSLKVKRLDAQAVA